MLAEKEREMEPMKVVIKTATLHQFHHDTGRIDTHPHEKYSVP